jgi:hypothetical protein
MKPLTLRAYIRPLPEYLPRTRAMEEAIGVGAGFEGAWYRSQKEHWLGWLAEYSGPGAYGRTDAAQRNGKYIYNHIQCAPMLFWLAEAINSDEAHLNGAYDSVTATAAKGASQCAALRAHLSWDLIETALEDFDYTLMQRIRIALAKR